MHNIIRPIAALALLATASLHCPAAPLPPRLWYAQPARNWNEALPVGNGRLGAMVFGGPSKERLQLNEESLWAGTPGRSLAAGLSRSISTRCANSFSPAKTPKPTPTG